MTQEAETASQLQDRERRVAVRSASTQKAPCHFATIEKISCRWASVRDVSKSGISLRLDCLFEPGQQLIIELPCKTLPAADSVTARVVRASEGENQTWLVGCVFERALTDAEYRAFL